MMHLWGKVYLEFDFRVYFAYNRFVVSKKYGFQFDQGAPVGVSTLHAFGQRLEDVIGDGKQFTTFGDFLAAVEAKQQEKNKPVYIYADREAYLEIATRWLKYILPNASLETIQMILRLQFVKEDSLAGIAGLGKGNDRPEMWYSPVDDNPFIEQIFDSAVEAEAMHTHYDDVKDRLSIEYLLPTFRSGDERFNEAFLSTFYAFMCRRLRDEVYDWRRYISLNIQNPKMMQLLDIPLDCFEIDLVPKALPLTNPRYWNRNGNFFAHSANPALMVDQMSIKDVEAMQELIRELREPYEASAGAPVRHAEGLIIDLLPYLVRGKILAIEAEEILADDRFAARNVWSGDEVDKVNFWLIDKLLKLQPDQLNEYILR